MAVEKENQTGELIDGQGSAPSAGENAPAEGFSNELREARWSVVSFDKIEAGALTYAAAEQKLNELERQKISGLCIITDEAAARIAKIGPKL